MSYPLGAAVTADQLTEDPHPVLRELRAAEPVSWLPALGGWLVTRRDLAEQVLRDPAGFTVDDPRFTTAQVVGPSMLSLDGAEHRRHREPFARALRRGDLSSGLAEFTTIEAIRLATALASKGAGGAQGTGPGRDGAGEPEARPGSGGRGAVREADAEPGGEAGVGGAAGAGGPVPAPGRRAELRRGLAGPLAVAVMGQVLGLGDIDPAVLLAWYDAIVAGVSELSAAPPGEAMPSGGPAPPGAVPPGAVPPGAVPPPAAAAFGELRDCLAGVIEAPAGSSLLAAAATNAGLSVDEIVSNAAVMLFGGIETTEGMICNAVWHLLSSPAQLAALAADRSLAGGAIDESLRLEPAAAVVDRYATGDVGLGPARVRAGDLVTVSLAGANRDPGTFPDPDRFDLRRGNARQNLGFALGPHFCVGAQLARMETQAALGALLDQLPGLALDPARPTAPRGLVFRKPPALHVCWDEPGP
jgi:cytochrome P450